MLTSDIPTPEMLAVCRFCSEVSQRSGEDPIGTAGTADHWLLVELKQPWTEEFFHTDPTMLRLLERFKALFFKHGIVMRPVLIAPDREYSTPGTARVIYYHRPQEQFSDFAKQEYVVDEADLSRLIGAILDRLMKKPSELDSFADCRRNTAHLREILVCTHGNIDVACAKFGQPIYRKLRNEYTDNLRVWRCSHFGGHKFAPTLIHLPDGRYWGHLTPEILGVLVNHEGSVEELRSHYRGWGGLSKFEQIAEREAWIREGWEWLNYRKSGRTLRRGLTGWKRVVFPLLNWIPLKQVKFVLGQWTMQASWAEVEVSFSSDDGAVSGTYRARVEKVGEVTTAGQSPKQRGDAIELTTSPQYRVSWIEKV
ncbi:MAG: sucrase ferredoxin [Geitlerinemataceae cyanobacterium]|mgnify:CR=1 FL=1